MSPWTFIVSRTVFPSISFLTRQVLRRIQYFLTCLSSRVAECYHNRVHQEAWKALFGKKSAVAETPEQGSSGKKKQNRQEKQPRKKLVVNRGNTDSSSSDSEQPVLHLKRLRGSSRPPPSSQPPKTAGYSERQRVFPKSTSWWPITCLTLYGED